MKTREIQCEYYICHNNCLKGKDADFYGICQHCGLYKKKQGAKPNRVDRRRKKLDKIFRRDKYE